MTERLRTSTLRVGVGAGLAVLAGLALLFVLPDASGRRKQQERTRRSADDALRAQIDQLAKYQAQADQVRRGRAMVEDLETHLPKGSLGDLHWELSRRLYTLAADSALRLTLVKYGAPNKEAAKGTNLESLDVECTLIGVYPALKKFMHALEGGKLPFGVAAARLDETPEGARLNLTLRAFRQSSTPRREEQP